MMRRHMRRYEATGQTVVGYCRQHQIALPTFYYWRKKLSGSPGDLSLQFEELQAAPKDTFPGIVMQFPQGVLIRFEGPVPASFIRELAGC